MKVARVGTALLLALWLPVVDASADARAWLDAGRQAIARAKKLEHPSGPARNAILFVGTLSLIGPFIGKSALTPIVTSSSLTFAAALTITCLSAIRLRKTSPLCLPFQRSSTVFPSRLLE